MEEFYCLFLVGREARSRAVFRRMILIVGALGALLELAPVLIAVLGGEHAVLIFAFSLAGLLPELLSNILGYLAFRREVTYVETQNARNEAELQGRDRALYGALYSAWKKATAKQSASAIVALVCRELGFALLPILVGITAYLSLPAFVLVAAFFVSAILLIVSFALNISSELSMRAVLYKEAGKEIDEIKRTKFGFDEKRIAREAETARAFSFLPAPVALFLKEKEDREAFRTVAKKSGIAGFIFGFTLGLILFLTFVISSAVDADPNVSSAIVLVLGIVVCVIYCKFIFPFERRKREIYQNNAEKLSEGEEDVLRRVLQSAWVKVQRAGNIMFSCFAVLPFLAGTVLSAVGYAIGAETTLFASIGTYIMVLLIPLAVLSLIVWAVMYAVYRKKVCPAELALREHMGEWV